MSKIFNYRDEQVIEGLPFIYGNAILGDRSFISHSHDYSEIIIIRRGHGIHSTSYGEIPIRAGDVYVIHPGISHGFRDSYQLEMINIGYRTLENLPLTSYAGYQALFVLEPMYRERGNFTNRLHLSPGQKVEIEKISLRIQSEIDLKETAYKAVSTGLFMELTSLLCRYYEQNSIKTNSSEDPGYEKNLFKLGQALVYLEDRYTEDISIEDLSRAAGYSVNHFTKICHRIYGVTPRQYILQQRLNLAVKILNERELNVSETAAACGFDDPNYFSRLFKKKMGFSPGDLNRDRN